MTTKKYKNYQIFGVLGILISIIASFLLYNISNAVMLYNNIYLEFLNNFFWFIYVFGIIIVLISIMILAYKE